MKKILIYVCVVMFLALIGLGLYVTHLTKEKNRLNSNQNALLSEVEYFRNKAGESQASVDRLQLTVKELKQYKEDLVSEVSNLNIKLKRVQSISQTATSSDVSFQTVFKDSLIIVEKIITDTIRCVEYIDQWTSFIGCENDGVFNASISSRDTLIQVIHRVPKKWWFFKWGIKGIKQEIVSKNPHNTIVFSEYIEISK